MVTSAMLARQVSHPNLPTVCFQELANPSPQPSISFTFVFMVLQTPFPANPFLAHQYKTPGVSRGTRFSDPAGRRIGPRPLRFSPSLTTFRMNTCKSVSKQKTLSPFRMNTYEKPGGGVTPPNFKSPLLNSSTPTRNPAIAHLWPSPRISKAAKITQPVVCDRDVRTES